MGVGSHLPLAVNFSVLAPSEALGQPTGTFLCQKPHPFGRVHISYREIKLPTMASKWKVRSRIFGIWHLDPSWLGFRGFLEVYPESTPLDLALICSTRAQLRSKASISLWFSGLRLHLRPPGWELKSHMPSGQKTNLKSEAIL